MTEETALRILAEGGAIIANSHLVYTSGRHGSTYVNKDALYTSPLRTSDMCLAIAQHFDQRNVQVVAAPAVGGVALTQWTAHHLNNRTTTHGVGEVLALYAEKDGDGFTFNRGYDALIPGKTVLVVEDVLTTGGSAKKVVDAVRKCGGFVVGLGVLCNRGNVQGYDVGSVADLFSLTTLPLESWDEEECPLCRQGVPINVAVGKGREFLSRVAAREGLVL